MMFITSQRSDVTLLSETYLKSPSSCSCRYTRVTTGDIINLLITVEIMKNRITQIGPM